MMGDCYVLLDVEGTYFFYPSWASHVTSTEITLNPRDEMFLGVMEFEVPASMPACGPYGMFAIVTNPDSYEVRSNLADTSFAFIH